ncbi:MAG: amidohydrolase [Nannocystaceae bacterium]
MPELVAIRHDLHQHPELGFEEHRTSGIVRAFLERHGYAPRTSAGTGVIVEVAGTGARRIALRADMDCLPMPEHTPLPYRSVYEGRAHKCGHDGHTAVLLGVAALLARRRTQLPGAVRLLFQPAEEGVDGGGARRMVEDGALAGCDEVYGLHNWPGYPFGHVHVKPGAMMAQTHWLGITVHGKGGHGSQPQSCRDPIVAASQIVVALQSVVARGLGYDGGAVVSVCRFSAGTTDNVLPDRAELEEHHSHLHAGGDRARARTHRRGRARHRRGDGRARRAAARARLSRGRQPSPTAPRRCGGSRSPPSAPSVSATRGC